LQMLQRACVRYGGRPDSRRRRPRLTSRSCLSAAQRSAAVAFRARAVAGMGRLRRLGRIVSRRPIFLFFLQSDFSFSILKKKQI
jgi:hypothetical protein